MKNFVERSLNYFFHLFLSFSFIIILVSLLQVGCYSPTLSYVRSLQSPSPQNLGPQNSGPQNSGPQSSASPKSAPPLSPSTSPAPSSSSLPVTTNAGTVPDSAWELVPEWNGVCQINNGAIDVNLGNSPGSFVQAAYCQINGTLPSVSTLNNWVNLLTTTKYTRRIDVVNSFCIQSNRTCTFQYSIPWKNKIPVNAGCTKKPGAPDIGIVQMFFNNCPDQPNCAMTWANTHPWGMNSASDVYQAAGSRTNFYNPKNVGFWLTELSDARYAGIQFTLPNVYGFDILPGSGVPENINAALALMGGGIKVALYEDNWGFSRSQGGSVMAASLDLSQTVISAQRIYSIFWEPFFSRLNRENWYTIKGRPVIVFYNDGAPSIINAGGLNADAVMGQAKQLFQAQFGVTPFVVLDSAFAAGQNTDARFDWDTFRHHETVSSYTINQVTWDHFMPKWDSIARDLGVTMLAQPALTSGPVYYGGTQVVKDDALLTSQLQSSFDSNVATIGTWNDLGEGTGIDRNYDYYFNGAWQAPLHFMNIVRQSQCSNF